MQYRLPTAEDLKPEPKSFSNPVKFLFQKGGMASMDWSENRRLFDSYPLTNSTRLAKRTKRPRGVKMLTSDFIEDSLYNPSYGYFSREVVIFQPDQAFNYNELKGQDDFMDHWLQEYDRYDKQRKREGIKTQQTVKPKSTEEEVKDGKTPLQKPSLQLWHTPTELFQPYYGEALGRYILANYKLNQYPYNDLVIYEVGAGNGTLMLNILDYLEKNEPEVYARTKYRIIEISSKLFNRQNSRLSRHMDKVEVINKSILEWNEPVLEPCFFIALEVFDNLSHDVVRYDIDTNQPYQGYVVVDEHNDFKEFYSPELDDWTVHYLQLREASGYPIHKLPEHPINEFGIIKQARESFNPLRNRLTDPEYIPTRLLKVFEILKRYFPNHQLLASDFSQLEKTINGYNSPVVQTMYRDNMVNVDSYMVDQGFFDIMFPTDFAVINSLYTQLVGKISNTTTHEEFLKTWGDVKSTTTKSGENPMLSLYSNASFIYS